ncbi:MAG: lactate utilization protein C, partial [Gemmatimonadaceae bacterium]
AAIAAGADVVLTSGSDVARIVSGAIENAASVLSYSAGAASTISSHGEPHVLATLDVLVCESSLGVAENGAVWIATSDTLLRAALFLASRVLIVVREGLLVDDLHQAYERLDVRSNSFGAFVAGPSKTADIEQSLVVGAHGPKELTLVVVRETE